MSNRSRRLRVVAFLAIANAPLSIAAEVAGHYDGPIIDIHAHLRLGDEPPVAPGHAAGTEALRKLDDAAGVARSALIVIAQKGAIEATRAKNDAVLKTAKESGGRFFPIVSVHPHDGAAALAELERVAKLGARIVKLHPNTQNFDVDDPAVGEVIERCGALNLPVLMDSFKPWDADQPGKFLKLALAHPRTKLILAHMGHSQFRQFLSFGVLKKLGMQTNVFFDTSALATTFADSPLEAELVWVMRQVGMDRMLFGSDWPVDTPAAAIDAVRRLGLDRNEEQLVLHDNAAALLR
jgi:uncharacterized protein